MNFLSIKLLPFLSRTKYITLIVVIYVFAEFEILKMVGAKGEWWVFLMLYSIDIFFFYFNCFFIFPLAYKYRKTIYKPFLFIIPSLIMHWLLMAVAYGTMSISPGNIIEKTIAQLSPLYILRVHWVAFLTAIPWGFLTYIQMLKRERVLENNVLFSRISPHLLFNSLNFVHSDVRKVSEKGDKMITLLAEYARYAMAELAEDGKTGLKAELAQLEILIKIIQLRFDDLYLDLKVHIKNPIDGYRIPPQVIVSLAENIFKYGLLNDPQKPVTIDIHDADGLLHIHMSNWKAANEGAVSSQMGLDNVKKRLSNIYNNLFTMKTDETLDFFSINLTIPL